jgi:hypothetical protein
MASSYFCHLSSEDRVSPENKEPEKKGLDAIYEKPYQTRVWLAGATLVVLGGLSIWYGAQRQCDAKLSKGIIWAAWTLGVPLLFNLEYWFLFRKHGNHTQFEHFKYAQETTSKVWLALVIVLGLEYFGKP